MDSFGTWQNYYYYFFFFYAEFCRAIWTINALLTVRSEMLPFSGNNQNIKMCGVPPKHFAIGYVHNHNFPQGNVALQYAIQNSCRKVWQCFLMISCTFWRSRIFFVKFTKTILWLWMHPLICQHQIDQHLYKVCVPLHPNEYQSHYSRTSL